MPIVPFVPGPSNGESESNRGSPRDSSVSRSSSVSLWSEIFASLRTGSSVTRSDSSRGFVSSTVGGGSSFISGGVSVTMARRLLPSSTFGGADGMSQKTRKISPWNAIDARIHGAFFSWS